VLILGIDPGTAITGFGLIEVSNGRAKLVDAGVIRTPAKQELPTRLFTIYHELSELIAEFQPSCISVERIYFAANVKTAISVSHARGIVLLLAEINNLRIAEYTPLEVKQAITGYGRADKKQMQSMVARLLSLNSIPKPDDAADALALALCMQQNLVFNKIKS
jgi:crossover junction endodeoxyribonuclease RuvC